MKRQVRFLRGGQTKIGQYDIVSLPSEPWGMADVPPAPKDITRASRVPVVVGPKAPDEDFEATAGVHGSTSSASFVIRREV